MRDASAGGVSLAVLIPSRGRPWAVDALLDAWRATGATATLVIGLDDDDSTSPSYPWLDTGAAPWPVYHVGKRLGLCSTTNELARAYAGTHDVLGSFGDDHRPRTRFWDRIVCDALAEMGTGIVYGDDLFRGEDLPTAVFMTADIVRTLGYMAPPELAHMYIDDTWREWGRAAGILRYLPEVVIEHLHPDAGKAEMDATYAEGGASFVDDTEAFRRYMQTRFHEDVAKLRALRVAA